MTERSPLASAQFPEMAPVRGVRMAATACGLRYRDRTDLMLATFDPGTAVAGVFTRSTTASAPVDWCREIIDQGRARALVVNSGNANAFTGAAGALSVRQTVDATAALVGCAGQEVYVASTGVIGEPLDAAKIVDSLHDLKKSQREDAWREAAAAIMTTDTFPKGASRSALLGDRTVTISGVAKGSGMIAPNMATMLAFLFTDAHLPAEVLRDLLLDANSRSFNAITVDSDTSTSDTVLLFATGAAENAPAPGSMTAPELQAFRAALEETMIDLAQQIVRDGEGASKFITITVTRAESDESAHKIALAIANSPLVKTAIAGEDANWGRIVMAVGKAGEPARRDSIEIRIGGTLITEQGAARPDYDERPVAAHMKGREIAIDVAVGVGDGHATVWTCDLTHGYISINADYRS